jgi:hypothetical protein
MGESLWADLRVAVRLLVRTPGVSLVAVRTLAVGMSASTLVFTVVTAVVLRPLPVHEPDRVVALSTAGETRTVIGVAPEGFTGLFRGIAPEFWVPLDEASLARAEDRTMLQWWVHAG